MEPISIGQRRKRAGIGKYTVTSGRTGDWRITWDPRNGVPLEQSTTGWSNAEILNDELIGHTTTSTQDAAAGTAGAAAAQWLRNVATLLEEKAAAYGDSAGRPMRVFSQASMTEQLLVRADDKLSRLLRGTARGEDSLTDLVGYLALLAAAGWKGSSK